MVTDWSTEMQPNRWNVNGVPTQSTVFASVPGDQDHLMLDWRTSTPQVTAHHNLFTAIKGVFVPFKSFTVSLGSFSSFNDEKHPWQPVQCLSWTAMALFCRFPLPPSVWWLCLSGAAVTVEVTLRGDERGVGCHLINVDVGGVKEDVVLSAEAGEDGGDAGH